MPEHGARLDLHTFIGASMRFGMNYQVSNMLIVGYFCR